MPAERYSAPMHDTQLSFVRVRLPFINAQLNAQINQGPENAIQPIDQAMLGHVRRFVCQCCFGAAI